MQIGFLKYPALAVAGAGYFLFLPLELRLACPVHLTTGLLCPGCGIQRSIGSLLSGNFEQAWAYNQLFVLSPFIILLFLILNKNSVPKFVFYLALISLGAVVVGFTIWRNLPGFSF
jgi:hypothetical protein